MKTLSVLILFAATGLPAASKVGEAAALRLYDGQQVTSRVVVGERLSEPERLAIGKLRKTARETFGFDLPVVVYAPNVALDGAIVLGTPDTNPLAAEARGAVNDLSPQ